MKIRDARPTDEDYAAMAAIQTAIYPDTPAVGADYREADEFMAADERCRVRRWLAEAGDQVVGLGSYWQHPGAYDPHFFGIVVYVTPEWQGQGIGSTLYRHVIADLEQYEPRRLRARSRTDQPRGLRFLAQRGFVEYHRSGESRLDVVGFDPDPYAALLEKVAAGGIVIRSLAELGADPQRNQKLHELTWQLIQDVPGAEDATKMSLEQWQAATIEAETALPGGYLVAVDDEDYVGLTELMRDRASDTLQTGLTGVLPAYRRRGIATALKVRAIAFARASGNPHIKTQNEVKNRPMLSINERLGFERLPDWIAFQKEIS